MCPLISRPTREGQDKLGQGRKKKARPLALAAARRPATDSFLPSHILPLSSLFLSSRLLRFFPCACFGHRLRELRLFLPAPKSKLRFRTLPALLFFFGASCEFFPLLSVPGRSNSVWFARGRRIKISNWTLPLRRRQQNRQPRPRQAPKQRPEPCALGDEAAEATQSTDTGLF